MIVVSPGPDRSPRPGSRRKLSLKHTAASYASSYRRKLSRPGVTTGTKPGPGAGLLFRVSGGIIGGRLWISRPAGCSCKVLFTLCDKIGANYSLKSYLTNSYAQRSGAGRGICGVFGGGMPPFAPAGRKNTPKRTNRRKN